MKKDESNNPYVEFPRINEVSYQNISSTYNKSETETLGDKRNTDTIMLNEIYKSRLEYTALWKKGRTLIVGDSMLYGIDETQIT